MFFTSGGSESADSAVRLARAYHVANGRPDRWKVIGRHPSYHGITLGALAAGSHSGRRNGYEPLLLDFPKVPWDDAGAVAEVIEREGAATIAGFLFEPITGAAGACLTPSDDYWLAVEDVCRRHGILLIADEVMTGLRAHRAARGVTSTSRSGPTSSSAARASAAGTCRSGWSPPPTRSSPTSHGSGFMFFTFTGSDAMCAGAAAVLEILDAEHLVERSAAMGDAARRRLAGALGGHPDVVEIRGRGLFRGVELTPSGGRFAAAVVGECLARDMWIYPGRLGAGAGRGDDRLPVHDQRGRDRAARRDARRGDRRRRRMTPSRCSPSPAATGRRAGPRRAGRSTRRRAGW